MRGAPIAPAGMPQLAREAVLAVASGNRLVVLDGTRAPDAPARPVPDRADVARRVARDLEVDGLLEMLPPRAGGRVRMVLHNADGSRAETCGNGLRVLTRLAVERGLAPASGFVIETDAGPRPVRARLEGAGPEPRVTLLRVSLGHPRLVERNVSLATPAGRLVAQVVDVGNPHCVVLVPDVARAPLEVIGPALERHARFPARTNVEVVARAGDGLALRVWERGVGETLSCGSGVVAGALAARTVLPDAPDLAGSGPIPVRTRGGVLEVQFDPEGHAWLMGPVEVRTLSWEDRRAIASALEGRA